MMEKSVIINLESGLEARPVAQLVQVASQFESKIFLEVEDKHVNAKSIMGMMSLGLAAGESVKIIAEGDDEVAAIESIEKYLSNIEG
jgi:catabolite repression HPr-like protein